MIDGQFNEGEVRSIMIKKTEKLDNNGFTLLEMVICFALLGILLVAASQIIAACTNTYFYTKSITYGIQASQTVATEVRGDIENALPLFLKENETNADKVNGMDIYGNYSVYIKDDGKGIAVINSKGEQISYYMETTNTGNDDKILVKTESKVYDPDTVEDNGDYKALDTIISTASKRFTTQYVGMNYRVIDINFSLFDNYASGIGNTLPGSEDYSKYPVIKLDITVNNKQYGDYFCTEYIPLYNFYGISAEGMTSMIHH